ncbi:MAG: PDZ domain-containing protein [Planctomycetes bacterium]|nr:PDZ domain-containing protein [Planctomycetota bacterium]
MQRIMFSLLVVVVCLALSAKVNATELQQTIRTTQNKVVKIFGAGGLRQLEAYQSGILISPEGHVLTALSYVLDTDDLAVILHDGRKWQAEFLGSDPITELALLKLPVEEEQLPHFNLRSDVALQRNSSLPFPGQRILALSNLYGIATGDEPVSVLQGVITAIAPLKARRGAYQANYRGQVYVLDAYTNNPGAAGGALVDWQGRLLGILGKELRSEVTGTWLNYALPTASFVEVVDDLRAGRLDRTRVELPPSVESHSTETLGIVLIPDVLPRTPAYIDSVHRDSPAERAGLRPDDLVVFIGSEPVDSYRAVVKQLQQVERAEPISISVLRDGALREFVLTAKTPSVKKSTPASDDVKP